MEIPDLPLVESGTFASRLSTVLDKTADFVLPNGISLSLFSVFRTKDD